MIRSSVRLIWAACWSISLAAQTQVDLRTQSKAVDFQAVPYTKPFKCGSALPPSCTQEEPLRWVRGSILDLFNGPGVILVTSDSGQSILIQFSLDTAFIETRSSEQSGAFLFCRSASGSSTTYSCFLSPTFSTYTAGMVLNWKPDANGTGGSSTLNVDTLDPASLKLTDGITDPALGDITAGRVYEIWYDGTGFRLMNPVVPSGVLREAQPGVDVRGRRWFVQGAAGVKDSLSACAKDASNAYAWRTLY